jgi:hypothetical protein
VLSRNDETSSIPYSFVSRVNHITLLLKKQALTPRYAHERRNRVFLSPISPNNILFLRTKVIMEKNMVVLEDW